MIWREDALGNSISDTGGDTETHMPIIGDQSMEEHVVKVEVMMDRGCIKFKDVLRRKDINISSMVKNPLASAGDPGDASLITGSGRTSGEDNGNPIQYSCLKNPMDRGDCGATVCGGHKESDTTE